MIRILAATHLRLQNLVPNETPEIVLLFNVMICMFRFCIFMSINKKNRNKRKCVEEIWGVPIHIIYMPVACYHILSNWAPNLSIDKVLLPNSTICK